ncbi:MAG TPA: DNA ligase D [Vitreimonas sp.]|uniref:DNA ligase D n=1 Tax=Vitreimonas sp. TaxID=3069702 RepID=UPI002D2F24DD|nr:DNA ligase D [Vitreimonas sp.]HYD87851.1 DNA ligase D [Vitreimonas sp.]
MARKTVKSSAPSKETLAEYNKKRDFGKTSEPAGGRLKSAGGMFVVQKHAATRLHYDFRLEHDGVLLSWAVPQGPSYDPTVKRLAMRTENHPLEYGAFEGVIPKGEYGAGAVIIWDAGKVKWVADPHTTLPKGELKFILDGERLKGEFHLVKIKPREGERGDPWLLFKSKNDPFAGKSDPVASAVTSIVSGRTIEDVRADGGSRLWTRKGEQKPRASKPPKWDFVEPMLATRVDEAPDGDDWIHEIKYDGYRLLAAVSGESVKLYTRNGLDWTGKFQSIADALAAMNLKDVLLDGEVAVAQASGRTDFGALQRSLESGVAKGVSYFVFDLLGDGAKDLRKRPFIERRERLETVLSKAKPPILLSPTVRGHGPHVLAAFADKGFEGAVSKKANSAYMSGRGKAWLKSKAVNEQEFVIVGYQPSAKGRAFASLMLADYEGGELVYRGNVGTGFNDKTLADLSAKLSMLERAKPALKVPREAARGAKWVQPKLVAQVRFTEFTADGAVRHGVYLGLRGEKSAKEVTSEMAAPAMRTRVRLTHPNRVLFPDAGVTKAELAAYLDMAAERMAPHVFGRPVSLVRAPDGVGKQTFFQKHAMAGMPSDIKTIPIAESDGSEEHYLTLPNAQALVSCAQISALEFHLWGSRNDDLERPDRVVFDLDPDEDLDFEVVKRAAFDIKALLDNAGLPSFAMATGGKGIHIVLNLNRRHDWDEVKGFAMAFAEQIAALDPKRFVANMAKAKRKGRIFVDYLRNGRGATAIAPYSPRARGTAPIATPVSWSELKSLASASAFKLKDMAARLAEPDPWTDYAKTTVSLTKAARAKLGLD